MTATTTPTIPARKKSNPLNLDWGLLLVVGVLLAFGLMGVVLILSQYILPAPPEPVQKKEKAAARTMAAAR